MTKTEKFHIGILQGIDAGRIYAALLDDSNAPRLFTDRNAPQYVLQNSLSAEEVAVLLVQPVVEIKKQ